MKLCSNSFNNQSFKMNYRRWINILSSNSATNLKLNQKFRNSARKWQSLLHIPSPPLLNITSLFGAICFQCDALRILPTHNSPKHAVALLDDLFLLQINTKLGQVGKRLTLHLRFSLMIFPPPYIHQALRRSPQDSPPYIPPQVSVDSPQTLREVCAICGPILPLQ